MIEQVRQVVEHALKDNQFFSGGLVLGALGTAVAFVRPVVVQAWQRLLARFFVTIEFRNNDVLFDQVQQWIAQSPGSSRFRKLSASYLNNTMANAKDMVPIAGSDPKQQWPLQFVPGLGNHFMLWNRRLVWIQYTRDTNGDTNGNTYKESIHLTVFCWNPIVARDLVTTAVDEQLQKIAYQQIIQEPSSYSFPCWTPAFAQAPRKLESVILPDGLLQDVVADVQRFLEAEELYSGLCIPYRRGYLFHGTPGSGKTSTVLGIAGHLRLPIYLMNLRNSTLSDTNLARLFSKVEKGGIILLEDIDVLFHQRADKEDCKVSFSGLLNAIDGIMGSQGRILIMTTNHREHLDPALFRPGRIDYQMEFRNATRQQALDLFNRFFPEASDELAGQFADQVRTERYSVAQLQGHLLQYIEAPQLAAGTPISEEEVPLPSLIPIDWGSDRDHQQILDAEYDDIEIWAEVTG